MAIGWLDELRKKEVKSGILRLDTEIHDDSSSSFMMELLETERLGNKEIKIWLTSPGGSAFHAFTIFDALEDYKSRGNGVEIVACGVAASAAAMIILQAATVRTATPNTRFLLHEIRQITGENTTFTKSDLEDQGEELKALNSMILEVLSRRTGKSKNDIESFFSRRDRWLGSKQAKDWGLIDRILGDE